MITSRLEIRFVRKNRLKLFFRTGRKPWTVRSGSVRSGTVFLSTERRLSFLSSASRVRTPLASFVISIGNKTLSDGASFASEAADALSVRKFGMCSFCPPINVHKMIHKSSADRSLRGESTVFILREEVIFILKMKHFPFRKIIPVPNYDSGRLSSTVRFRPAAISSAWEMTSGRYTFSGLCASQPRTT